MDQAMKEKYQTRSPDIKQLICVDIKSQIANEGSMLLPPVAITCMKESMPTIGSVSVDPPMSMHLLTQADAFEAVVRSIHSQFFDVAAKGDSNSLEDSVEQTNTGSECDGITTFMDSHRDAVVCDRFTYFIAYWTLYF